MSSYNDASRKIYRGEENRQSVHINERAVGSSSEFIGKVMDNELLRIEKEVKEKKKELLQGLMADKEAIIADYRKEAVEIAKEELRKETEDLIADKLNNCAEIYKDAIKEKARFESEAKKSVDNWIRNKHDELERLIFKIASKVAREYINQNHVAVKSMIRSQLNEITTTSSKLRVFLSHSTNEALSKVDKNELQELYDVEWVVDNMLGFGEFVVETSETFYDGRIDVQLENIRKQLKGDLYD